MVWSPFYPGNVVEIGLSRLEQSGWRGENRSNGLG
jgi:hypothetical protein